MKQAKPSVLDIIKSEEVREKIKQRCGTEVVADGIKCPHCGCLETFKSARDQQNTDKWFFMIRAFRVDNASECTNCGQWFPENLGVDGDFTTDVDE